MNTTLNQIRRQVATTSACVLLLCAGAIAIADEEAPIVPKKVELGRPINFAEDIAPIFRTNCVACHNKAKSEGQLILEDVASILKGGSSGEVVVPGKPDDSYLYNVAARIDESYMPPMPNEVQAQKLTSAEVGLLRQWIVEGAKAGSAIASSEMNWQAINTELNAIYAVDTDPFGRFVAAGRAGNVRIYDLVNPANTSSLVDPDLISNDSPQQQAHQDYVHAIAFHPDGNLLATSGFQVVKIWERDLASTIEPWAGLPGDIANCVASTDAKATAVQTKNGTISIFTGNELTSSKEITGYPSAKWTLLGLGGADNQQLIVGSPDGDFKVVNLKDSVEIGTGEPLSTQAMQAIHVETDSKIVVLHEDGTLNRLVVDNEKRTLQLVDVWKSDKGPIREIALAGKQLMCRIEGNHVELRDSDSLAVSTTIQSATKNVAAAISPNAERVATVGTTGVAELWDARNGKLIATLNSDLLAEQNLLNAIRNQTVRDARVEVVKNQIKEDEKRVAEQQVSLKKANEEVKKATEALTAAEKKAEDESAKLAAATKASEEKPDDAGLKKKLEDATKAEATSREGTTTAENALASARKGVELSKQAIKRAEVNVAERKQLLTSVEAEAKVAGGSHAIADSNAKKTVSSLLTTFIGNDLVATVGVNGTTRLWDSEDGSAVDVLPAQSQLSAQPTSLTSNGKRAAMRHADGTISVVHPFPKWKLSTKLGPGSEGTPSIFSDRILALAFSPDGKTLAAGGGEASRSGELTLWNVADGKLLQTIEDAHSDTVYGLDFSRDGKLLASAAADKFVKVFNVQTGKHIRSYEGHTHHVMDVSWNFDRTKLASAGADNAIKVWNAETGEQSRTITTYKKQVTSLEFLGKENEFISCSGDKRVFRHRADNGKTIREFKGCPDYVYCSATTTDGAIVAAGCEDGILRIWSGKDGKEIAAFQP